MMQVLSREKLEQGIRDVDEEARGVLAVMVVRPIDAVTLIGEALAGDQESIRVVKAMAALCSQIDSAPKKRPILCISCPRPLQGSGHSFAFAMAGGDNPSRMIGLGICPHCATTQEDITAKSVTHLRKIWPDLRKLAITHPEGGRA